MITLDLKEIDNDPMALILAIFDLICEIMPPSAEAELFAKIVPESADTLTTEHFELVNQGARDDIISTINEAVAKREFPAALVEQVLDGLGKATRIMNLHMEFTPDRVVIVW